MWVSDWRFREDHHLSQGSQESRESQESQESQECQERQECLRTLYVFAT